MDAEQINKRIHEWLGKCWHESKDTDRSAVTCEKCGSSFGGGYGFAHYLPGYGFAHYLPDYTTDLNAVRKAELKCIEEFGRDAYLNALTDQVVVLGDFNERDTDDLAIATASALTRAQAVCDVLEVGKC